MKREVVVMGKVERKRLAELVDEIYDVPGWHIINGQRSKVGRHELD